MGFAIPAILTEMGVSAATAATIGTVASIAGTGFSVLGALKQGQAASDSAKYNAAVQTNNAQTALNNARLAGQEGDANTAIEQQKTRANVAGIKAATAANGVDVNSGSAVDVQSSASELGELNAITIRSNAARKAYGYQNDAASDKAQAELDKEQAKDAARSGYIGAATSLLSNTKSGSDSGLWGSFVGKNSLNSGSSSYWDGYSYEGNYGE